MSEPPGLMAAGPVTQSGGVLPSCASPLICRRSPIFTGRDRHLAPARQLSILPLPSIHLRISAHGVHFHLFQQADLGHCMS